jgi:DNA adenine methylase
MEGALLEFAPEKKLRPLLKWAGGKRWAIPYLLPMWNRHANRRLVEPLCGGLAVTFGLRPRRALLNDVNVHLVNFYKQVKSGLTVSITMENEKETYYLNRDRFNELIKVDRWNTPEAAQLFYYLNRTGYNGLCRFNSSGLYNVPFGRYNKINYMQDFHEYKTALSGWDFLSGDFSGVKIEDNDFVYVDPPYDVDFRQYSSGGFFWKDQVRLAKWASSLRVPVAISNQATERVVELYKDLGFSIQLVEVPRFINSVGTGRGSVKEVLGTRGF